MLVSISRHISRPKDIKFGQPARELLLEGVEKISNAVITTMGPKGRNAMIENPFGAPKVTKDGVSVAKEIEFADRWHNMGAQLVLSVAQKTNDAAGDGTTTATLLTTELYRESLKALTSGLDANKVRKGMRLAVDSVLSELKKMTKKVTTKSEIAAVATISANGDSTIGNMIADAFNTVGQEGVITIENGTTFEHHLETVKGMKLDHGYIAPLFATNPKNLKCEYDNAYILATDMKISTFSQIQPLLEQIVRSGRPLLIIADDIDGEALTTLLVNKIQGNLKVVPVKAPGFGDNKKAILQDIAILTGGQFISEDIGFKIESIKLEQLGSAKRINVSKDNTIILEGQGQKIDIDSRADVIRKQISTSDSKYEKEKLTERLAKLTGGVAVIKVGGGSEVAVSETKDLFEDALNATRAAIEEGIVPGGGCALLRASQILKNLKPQNLEEKTGIEIVEKAILMPIKQIVKNAGLSGDVIVQKILSNKQINYGYDARNGKFVDLVKSGIIDPTKVVRLALANAASVASSMTSAEVLIVNAEDLEKKLGPHPASALGY